jgi:hypothetical protein
VCRSLTFQSPSSFSLCLIGSVPAQAGHNSSVGAGLFGFGIGAIVGSALAPREVYVVPPPPPAYYYGPVGYGPPTWSPAWYSYCSRRYVGFDPRTGYYVVRGRRYFCY